MRNLLWPHSLGLISSGSPRLWEGHHDSLPEPASSVCCLKAVCHAFAQVSLCTMALPEPWSNDFLLDDSMYNCMLTEWSLLNSHWDFSQSDLCQFYFSLGHESDFTCFIPAFFNDLTMENLVTTTKAQILDVQTHAKWILLPKHFPQFYAMFVKSIHVFPFQSLNYR